MLKVLRAATFILLTSPLLIQCVPAQDVNSLDLRVRNLDNQVFQLGKTVNQLGGGSTEDTPLGKIQAKQAELVDSIDRLNTEVMQLKGQVEGVDHQLKTAQADTDLKKKVEYLSQQFAALSTQVNQNTVALKSAPPMVASAATPAKALDMSAGSDADQTAGSAGEEPSPAPADQHEDDETKKVAPADDSGKAVYDHGLELFRASKFNEAYQAFSEYLSKYPKGKMAPNARFWLGDCYYNQQEYELAILEYQKVIADYPNDGKAPAALLKQGLAFEKTGYNDTAKIVYDKLLREYPKSDQVEIAKKRLDSFK